MRFALLLVILIFPALGFAECRVVKLDHVKIEARLEELLGIQKNLIAIRRAAPSGNLSVTSAMFTTEQLISRAIDHGLYLRPYWNIYIQKTASDEIRALIDEITAAAVVNSRSTAVMSADFLTNLARIVPERRAEIEEARDGLRRWEASLACD